MTGKDTSIAIVGYACRLPSAADVDEFWSILTEGRCVVSEVQPDRWSMTRFGHPDRNTAGRSYTFAAGQIDDVWGFDPGFFGISPREAVQMDPQQRLLLQVTWEALEHAGIRPSALAGSETGVFVGVSGLDHSNFFLADPAAMDIQMMTGNTLSIVSNRISYIFDLVGPSFTVDTACSSSLVALHQAAEAMRSGRIETAIVGGVNILLSPSSFIGFSRASMLSPTGLCRAFDADADGYVRSEGAVVLVLKTVAAARAAGDRILGVIEGSGVNADGRTNGLSLPSSDRQADLLRDVYATFGIDPESLGFIEAHGTGTRVGDPAEARALGSILGKRRSAPLPIGSVKTNVGHLESASGLVGLLKAQLSLEHEMVPASLHLRTPNPDIPFDDLNLSIVTTPLRLAERSAPYRAGINSFGFGGANAHVVLRQPAPDEIQRSESAGVVAPLILTARSPESLAAGLGRLRDTVERATTEREVAALSNALAWRRERHEQRIVLPARSRDGLLTQIARAIEDVSAVPNGRALADSRPVAFLYSGNGSQWAGMGRHLSATDPVFLRALEDVDALFLAHAGWSLASALDASDLDERLERTDVAQPLLFAIQVGLTRSLAARGLVPAAVAGHSVGEVAAAWASGAVDLPTAVRIIYARSLHQQQTHGAGSMAAVLVDADSAASVISEEGFATLSVAAVNSPRSITISGAEDELVRFGKLAKARRWAYRRLKLAYPFHSGLVDPIRAPMLEDLAAITAGAPAIPFYSTVEGVSVDDLRFDAEYWWENVRRPVMFSPALVRMAEDGLRVFLEIGPKPILQTYVADSLNERFSGTAVLPSLLDGAQSSVDADEIVAKVLSNGGAIDEVAYFGPKADYTIRPPLYAWTNAPYRLASTDEAIDIFGRGQEHPLLGARLVPGSGPFLGELDPDRVSYLQDHKVQASTVFPAAGFVELVLAAARAHGFDGPIELSDFEVFSPLVFDGDQYETKVEVQEDGGLVWIWTRRRLARDDWRLNARGSVASVPRPLEPSDVPEGGEKRIDHDDLYRLTARFGLHYGPQFRRARTIKHLSNSAVLMDLDPLAPDGHHLHPAVLDSAFHGLLALIAGPLGAHVDSGTSYLPVRIGRLALQGAGSAAARALVELERASPRSIQARIELLDAEGGLVARLDGVRFRAVALDRASTDELTYVNRLLRLSERQLSAQGPSPLPRDPVSIAIELGLTASNSPEPEAGALLVDAAARRIAWDALAAVFPGGIFDIDGALAAGRLAPNAVPLVTRLLQAFRDDGAVSETLDAIVGPCPYPEEAALFAALVAEAPQRIAETMALTRLSVELTELLRGGLPEVSPLPAAVTEHLATTAPVSAPLAHALATVGKRLVAEWPSERPLSVLVIGGDPVALSVAVLEDQKVSRVVATDPSDERAARLALTAPRHPRLKVAPLGAAGEEAGFDLILFNAESRYARDALSAIAVAAAPHARLLIAAPEPSLLADLIYGMGSAWWSGTIDPTAPIGGRLSGREWEIALTELRMRETSSSVLATEKVSAVLVTAEAPRASGDRRSESTTPVIVLSDRIEAAAPISAEIVKSLKAAGRTVEVAAVDGDGQIRALEGPDDRLLQILGSSEPKDVIHLHQLDARTETAHRIAERAMSLHDLLLDRLKVPARVWIVASGGNPAHAGEPEVGAAGIWGLGRVLMNECAEFDIRLVDVQGTGGIGRFVEELLSPSDEKELVLTDQGRHAVRIEPLQRPSGLASQHAELMLELSIRRQGSLDSLAWNAKPRPALGTGEVEIEVAATGLNFRDVMWAQGLLPEEALEDGFAGATLGMECSGVVARVGPGCARFRPGDRVIAFAPACFATHVVVSEKALSPLPGAVDLEAAATIPVTFLTAYYALAELARVEKGEIVLIHGGAGGVGLAALQIALARGARIFATAGSREKRRLLSLLGAERVFDSRSLAFELDVLDATGGTGVDVVLNSLNGEAMERSIRCLKPFGRFVELGKRDYYANTRIGLRPFRQNLSYFGVDADQLLAARPALTARLLEDILQGFSNGVFTPLPYRVFEGRRASDAFRLMQQSGHTGKIVVVPPALDRARPLPVKGIRADATYLLVGGLGGFGVETARFLVDEGARNIALNSRSGTVSREAAVAIDAMRAAGARVEIFPGDVAERSVVEAMLSQIDRTMPALRGVFHTAMVLDDALFANLDKTRFDAVLRPKVAGALNLDGLTRGRDLDHFVLYSSATTLIGNPGQANYVAANAALEQIAARRRQAGLPGLAIAWGAISDAGYLSRNADVREVLSDRLGKDALSAREALQGLRWAMAADIPPAVAFARMDWAQALRELPIMSAVTLSGIASTIERTAADSVAGGSLAQLIAGMEPAAANKAVIDLLAGELSRILRLPADSIDPERPLTAIGMDSLMALELRMAAEQKLGIDIPLLALANGATLQEIARRIVERVANGSASGGADDDHVILEQHMKVVGDGAGDLIEQIEERAATVRKLIR